MREFRALMLVVLLFATACGDSDLFNPNTTGPSVQLQLRPVFSLNSSSLAMVDIHRIRLTVSERPSGRVVLTEIRDVDPTANSWDVALEVPPNAQYVVLIELINVTNGVESVQFSGEVTVNVTTGPQPPPSVTMVVGPPENLRVTSIAISPRDQSVLETESVQLNATVGGVQNAVINWRSSNADVASVDNSGRVTARSPGQATIFAQAGAHTDQINITVGARAERIELTPANVTLTSIGADATFAARVLDTRGAVVPGVTATLSITDPNIAAQLAPGVFRALRNGSTTVTATATQNGRVLNASAPLVVAQLAVSISIDPSKRTFESLGDTQQFTALAHDANKNPLSGVAFAWTSSNAAVATVDANGVVTARGDGEATIKVTSGGSSAEANVVVQQTAVDMHVDPTEIFFTYLGATMQIRAQPRDARGNPVNVPVRYFIAGDVEVATTTPDGVVRANAVGNTTVMVTAGKAAAGVSISVTQVPTRMVLNATELSLDGGKTFQATAAVQDAGGTSIPATVTWSSVNTNVATVTSSGLITGISSGETEIVARALGVEGRITVTVSGSAPTGVFHIANGRVLLYNADWNAQEFKNRLVATGVYTADKIDVMSMFSPLPSLTTLSQYGCVLAWTNSAPSMPVQIGDRLKEYVDAGGKVVLAVYGLGVPSRPWELQGGIMGSGYNPLLLTENQVNDNDHVLNMSTALTGHPIMQGVTSFSYISNSNYTRATLATGATLVGSDNHGDPIIAVNSNGRVVALNVWPGYAYHDWSGVYVSSRSSIDRAFANACR